MISGTLMSRLNDCLSSQIGLSFPEKRWHELERKLAVVMEDFEFRNLPEFIHWLLSAPLTRRQVESLAFHLTIKETYFFREIAAFSALEHSILPGLIVSGRRTDKRIRIWSAGCSTGEEPYSVAMLLCKLIPDIQEWNITIAGTDINPRVLEKAREGVYSEWSFRDTPSWVKDRYFEKRPGGRYAISSPVKRLVTFSYLNLVEDVYPSLATNTNAMDIILCRNVLMYFARDCAASVVERCYRSLAEGGILIPGVVEVSSLFSSQFSPLKFQDATFYKKAARHHRNRGAEQVETDGPSPAKKAPSRRIGTGITGPGMRSQRRPAGKADLKDVVPSSKPTPYEEALDLYQRGLCREAEDKVLKLLGRDKENLQAARLLTRILANQGRLEDAADWCERAISLDKLNPGLYYLRATILEELGRTDEAVMSLNKTLYLQNDFVLAHFAVGNLKMKSGKVVEARKWFRNAAELLSRYGPEEIIPESEGITAARLSEITRAIVPEEK